jgi:peptidoglycan L-alanyl-D-glutamate endopeptidase CwlK
VDATQDHLDRLKWAIADRAIDLINTARNDGYPLVITSSTRTAQQQQSLVRTGRSRTLQSKHLLGLAFDVDLVGWNRDAVPEWFWQYLGPLGERFGLTWGGRWISFRDVGHFEI